MEFSVSEIDNILRNLGMDSMSSAAPSTPPVEPVTAVEENTEPVEASDISEEDFDTILADNGFTETTEEDYSEDEEEEYDEDDIEIIDRNTPNEALPENYVASHVSRPTPPEEVTTQTVDSAALPLNSPTLLIDESTSRFSGTEWFNEIKKSRIVLAGIGGIGSNVAFQLARMAPTSITLYDDDNVEEVNMAGQLFSMENIGMAKVDAIANMIASYTNMQQVYAIKERFTEDTEVGDIMICGFDNMEARKTFFNAWKEHVNNTPMAERKKCLYLDGRLSIDTLQIFAIRGDDDYSIRKYLMDYMFSDSEADHTVCSMKQTTYLACMIGSLIVNLFTNHIANLLNPIIPYDLPFFTEYDSHNMIFKTDN